MRFGDGKEKLIAFGALMLLSTPFAAQAATHTQASTHIHHVTAHHTVSTYHSTSVHHVSAHHSVRHIAATHAVAHTASVRHVHYTGHSRYHTYRVSYYHGVQCVAFAKADSGVVLRGNAVDWWAHAAGVYQRGSNPEVGAVLNFRANPRMRLGHVAVVSNVIDARTVEIDQANWGSGSSTRHGGAISRSTMVVDVSPNNDWTAVRVGLDHAGDYGSIYPTYGFIYARPDNGTQLAANTLATAPASTKNTAPSDLRRGSSYDEVAESPQISGVDTGASLGLDAPDRAIQ